MDNKPKAYSYIRFSTTEQERGDSLRRQESEAKKYAEEHGLILDENQQFKDLGKSGYKGFNRIKGALKDFIDLVDSGKIPKGSVLIVEHLDRLSREKVSIALRLFMDLLEKGIQIVTLNDRQRYDERIIDENLSPLLISITLMSAAHDESLKKSKRIRKALEEKREKLRNNEIKIYSAKCPLWLELSADKTEFVPIKDACEAINLIFKKRLEGKGSYKIEKELNSDPDVWKPPISSRNKSGGWRDAYISKILRNRKLIGEYQPHEMKTKTIIKNGKEEERELPVAKGDRIKDYYPKVIDEGLFYRAQELIKQNSKFPGNGGGGGNKDKGNNLFSHVVKCGICGSSMQFVDKGIQYLICDSKRRKNKIPIRINQDSEFITVEKVCTSKSVRYDEFERIFFENVNELDIDSLLPNEDETTRIKKQKEKVKEVCSFLESGKDEQERINRRFQLRLEIQNMIERIEIYTSKEESKKHKAKTNIDWIKIRFKASKTFSKGIFVKSDGVDVMSRRRPGAQK